MLLSSLVFASNPIDKSTEVSVATEPENVESSGKEPIVWSGKQLGYLEWQIVKYNGIMQLKCYNNCPETINFCITGKRAESCTNCGFSFTPYQEKDIYFACSDEVSDFSFTITVDD